MATRMAKAEFYNEIYKRQNYFRYRTWVYEPYVCGLIAACGLRKGASLLDVGCGQGLFSYLFSKHGMKVHGIDLSQTGIELADELYGRLGITFSVADIQTATFAQRFDCIFVRSCSLYNTEAFALKSEITECLMKHLKDGGVFIFAYNSNFSSKHSSTWRYHSLGDVEQHFASYSDTKIFFVSKITAYVLRKHTFTSFVTRLNVFLSKANSMGGDLVCIVRKHPHTVREERPGYGNSDKPTLASGR